MPTDSPRRIDLTLDDGPGLVDPPAVGLLDDGDDRRDEGAPEDRAECSACNAVCCRLTVVLDTADDIPLHLTTVMPGGVRVMAKGRDGWCVAMDAERMNCGIYETRPSACRRFAMSGPYCRAVRMDFAMEVAAGKRSPRAISGR